jgi:hypothetical protein
MRAIDAGLADLGTGENLLGTDTSHRITSSRPNRPSSLLNISQRHRFTLPLSVVTIIAGVFCMLFDGPPGRITV